jgi:heme A synthase
MSTPPDTFLSLHIAVVLLAAVVIGMVIGCLTVLTGAPVAAAAIAGVSSADGSFPALRTLIG